MEPKSDTRTILEQIVAIVSRLFAEMETVAFKQEGFAELSMRQVLYIDTIAHMECPSFGELAEALGISRPSVTVLVGKLIRKGYLQKVQDGEDRRSFHIHLTEKGRQFTRLHKNVHERMVKVMIERLSETEVEQLAMLMKKAMNA